MFESFLKVILIQKIMILSLAKTYLDIWFNLKVVLILKIAMDIANSITKI